MGTLAIGTRSLLRLQDVSFSVREKTAWQGWTPPRPMVTWSRLIVSSALSSPRRHWREGASADILGPSEEGIELLAVLYQFRDYVMVATFLRENRFLTGLLLEAYERIKEYFGWDTQVALEVFTDPEATSDRELFALVQTAFSPNEALSRLDHLDQDWWLEASSQARCRLNIDVEYL